MFVRDLRVLATGDRAISTQNAAGNHVNESGVLNGMANPTEALNTTMMKFEVDLLLDRVPRTALYFTDLARLGRCDGVRFYCARPGLMDQFSCPHAKDQNSSRARTLTLQTLVVGGPCPWIRLTSVWGLLRESSQNCRNNCNE